MQQMTPMLLLLNGVFPGEVMTSGNPYEMSYATFVTARGGLIVHYREYWNPQVFINAMDGGTFASNDAAEHRAPTERTA